LSPFDFKMNTRRINRQGTRQSSGAASVVNWQPAVWLLLLTALSTPHDLPAQSAIRANAVLTSQSGTVRVSDASGQAYPVEARSSLLAGGLAWHTEEKSEAFLVFSNGTALGIGQSTRIRVLEYQQRPFSKEKAGFSYEPSTSKLSLALDRGEIVLVCERLSPVSELRLDLPQGSLRIHRGVAHIRYDQTGLHIAMIAGNLTYDYPGGTAREIISAGSRIRISDQSAQRREIAEQGPLAELPADASAFYQATQHASRRVFFQANAGTAAPPRPLIVTDADFYEQPSPRPYEFKE
jgi:hypothetical protein